MPSKNKRGPIVDYIIDIPMVVSTQLEIDGLYYASVDVDGVRYTESAKTVDKAIQKLKQTIWQQLGETVS